MLLRSFFVAVPAALILSACAYAAPSGDVGISPPANASGRCNAGAVQAMVGQRVTEQTGAEILSLSGARTLRWGPPDAVFTMDFREDRVNVIYDRAMVITQITCG